MLASSYRRVALHRTVIVNLRTGKAVRGVLMAYRGPVLVLKNAELIEARAVVPVDGDVVIERTNVDFVQVMPSSEG